MPDMYHAIGAIALTLAAKKVLPPSHLNREFQSWLWFRGEMELPIRVHILHQVVAERRHRRGVIISSRWKGQVPGAQHLKDLPDCHALKCIREFSATHA